MMERGLPLPPLAMEEANPGARAVHAVPCALLGLSPGTEGTEKWAPQIKDKGEKQTGQGMFSEQLLCVRRCF